MELPVLPWRILCLTALIAVTIFSFTLTSAVPVWIDESMIVEYGHVTLAGEQPVYSASINARIPFARCIRMRCLAASSRKYFIEPPRHPTLDHA